MNEVLANGLREALKMPKEGHVRTWSLDNFNAYYASVIGHELFHVAVGDTSGERSVGDCEGSGTCMAYRVQAKILNEILYGGPRGYYLPNSRITGNDKGQWAYDQAALNYPGAIEFDRQFSTNKPYFRVDPNMIRALVVVAPPQSRP